MKSIFDNKSRALSLIFLGWLVYTVSYFGKVNYSANITQIIDFYNVSKAQAGAVPTFFFFAYGIGQVVNGLFCKKYNIKWMIFTSLITSSIVNLIIAVSTNFPIIKWLWLLNGLALSILWPTLIRLISEATPQKILGKSTIIMGTTVATGTLIIYGLSSLFAFLDCFKLSFYTASFSILVVALIWLIFYNKIVAVAKKEKAEEKAVAETKTEKTTEQADKKADGKLFFVSIYVLCFCAIGVNLIKDGLTTWVPSILKDEFSMSDSLSILLTLFLPILAVFGNAYAIKAHKKIPDYVNHCGVIFSVIAAMILVIIGSLSARLVIVMLLGLIASNFFASSLNSLITSIYPLFMRGRVNSGLIAGVLNGFCYLGSTISSYGLGAIADNFGWRAVFFVLLGFCGLILIVWSGYHLYKRSVSKKNI